jgi:hypothetical protein
MKSIRKKRNALAAAFILCALLTASLCVMKLWEAGAVAGAFTATLLYLLSKQQRRFHQAELICDNPILQVPSAIITRGEEAQEAQAEETIVSTFGVLIGNEVWAWGYDGAYSIRLGGVKIDRLHILLSFGDGEKTMQVRLLHGLSEQEEVCAVSDRLRYETGVTAEIVGW